MAQIGPQHWETNLSGIWFWEPPHLGWIGPSWVWFW